MRKLEIIAEQNSPGDEMLIIHEILASIGDKLEVDQPIFIVEGAKSIFDIVCESPSIIVEILVTEGEVVPIGTVLAILNEA